MWRAECSGRCAADRGEDAVEVRFKQVKVVLRHANGDERAWRAEVDASARIEDHLPHLVQALPIEGDATDYELRSEGSLDEPVLVLTAKPQAHVHIIEELGP